MKRIREDGNSCSPFPYPLAGLTCFLLLLYSNQKQEGRKGFISSSTPRPQSILGGSQTGTPGGSHMEGCSASPHASTTHPGLAIFLFFFLSNFLLAIYFIYISNAPTKVLWIYINQYHGKYPQTQMQKRNKETPRKPGEPRSWAPCHRTRVPERGPGRESAGWPCRPWWHQQPTMHISLLASKNVLASERSACPCRWQRSLCLRQVYYYKIDRSFVYKAIHVLLLMFLLLLLLCLYWTWLFLSKAW